MARWRDGFNSNYLHRGRVYKLRFTQCRHVTYLLLQNADIFYCLHLFIYVWLHLFIYLSVDQTCNLVWPSVYVWLSHLKNVDVISICLSICQVYRLIVRYLMQLLPQRLSWIPRLLFMIQDGSPPLVLQFTSQHYCSACRIACPVFVEVNW